MKNLVLGCLVFGSVAASATMVQGTSSIRAVEVMCNGTKAGDLEDVKFAVVIQREYPSGKFLMSLTAKGDEVLHEVEVKKSQAQFENSAGYENETEGLLSQSDTAGFGGSYYRLKYKGRIISDLSLDCSTY